MGGAGEGPARISAAHVADMAPFHPDLLDVYLRRRSGGGGVYIALILLFIAALAALPLVKIPISVSAHGFLRAAAESHSLIAPSSGEVAWVNARERQPIEPGDTILLLHRPDLRVRLDATRARRSSLEREGRDLEELLAWAESGGADLRPASLRYHEEWRAVFADLQAVAGRLRSSRREAFRSAALFNRGLTSAAELAAMEDRVQELRQDSVVLRTRTAAKWRGELARLQQELRNLQAEEVAVTEEMEQLAVTAPVAGTLDDIAALSKGSFVPAGQHLATLTPASPLVAELYVNPDELDGIQLGSSARLHLTSRRFERTGAARGRVIEIEPRLVRTSDGSAGRIRVAPSRSTEALRPGAIALRRGSSVTARIPVGRRSLWALLRHRRNDLNPGPGAPGALSPGSVE